MATEQPADGSPPQNRRKSRASSGGTFMLNGVLLAVPLLIYFFIYVDGRERQINVRNFNALNSASERVAELVAAFPQLGKFVPFPGLDPKEFVEETFRSRAGGKSRGGTEILSSTPAYEATFAAYRGQLQEIYSLSSTRREYFSPIGESPDGRGLLSQIESVSEFDRTDARRLLERLFLQDLYANERKRILGAPQFDVYRYVEWPADAPASNGKVASIADGSKARPDGSSASAVRPFAHDLACPVTDGVLVAGPQPAEEGVEQLIVRKSKVYVGAACRDEVRLERNCGASALQFIECRKEKRAISQAQGQAVDVIASAPMVLSVPLSELMKGVLPNLHGIFDEVALFDDTGALLYSSGRFASDALADDRLRWSERISFVHFRDMDVGGQTAESGGQNDSVVDLFEFEPDDRDLGRHSTSRAFRVGGIDFTAFIHPFDPGTLTNALSERRAESNWYLVGIASQDRIGKAATDVSLRFITIGLAVIAILIAGLIFLWLQTAGTRLVLLRGHFVTALVSGGLVASFAALLAALIFEAIRYDFRVGANAKGHAQSMVAAVTKELIERSKAIDALLAQCETDESGAVVDAGTRTSFETAFVLSPEGLAQMTGHDEATFECARIVSNRIFKTPTLDLGFREYFRKPQEGVLYDLVEESAVEEGEARPPRIFIERITSILDASVETVISAPVPPPPGDAGDKVAVAAAVIRLDSLDGAVLPHPYEFVVVDRTTGRTQFHSDRDRSLSTNFAREVGYDGNLVNALRFALEGRVQLDHNGRPISGWIQPLGRLPWSLIVYRGQELEDASYFVSMAATLTLFVVAFAGGVALLAFKSVRRRVLRFWPLRAHGVAQAELAAALLWLVGGVLFVVSIWYYHLIQLGGVSLLLGGLALVASASHSRVFAWPSVGRLRNRYSTVSTRLAEPAAVIFPMLVVFFVLPLIFCFGYFDRVVADGLACYSEQATDVRGSSQSAYLERRNDRLLNPSSLRPKRTHTDAVIRDDGICLRRSTGAGLGQMAGRFVDRIAAASNMYFGVAAANAATGQQAVDDADDDGQKPGGATPNFNARDALAHFPNAPLLVIAWLTAVAFTVFVVFWVARVIDRRMLRAGMSVPHVPEWRPETADGPAPLEFVICEALYDPDPDIVALAESSAVAELVRTGSSLNWRSRDTADIYLVRCFETASGLAGFAERMREAMATRKRVVIFASVVPYHYFTTGEPSYELAGLIAKFQTRRLRHSRQLPNDPGWGWATGDDPQPAQSAGQRRLDARRSLAYARVTDERRAFGSAFDELCITAWSRARDGTWDWSACLNEIRRSAAPMFLEVWKRSTTEEQLELYALSRGGFANPSSESAIVSLKLRGLVSDDGLVRLKSRAFARFVLNDLDHSEILEWSREEQGVLWSKIWQPIVIVVGLLVAFVFASTPERLGSMTAIFASALGALPILSSVFGGMRGGSES